jgi:hypothetical protein
MFLVAILNINQSVLKMMYYTFDVIPSWVTNYYDAQGKDREKEYLWICSSKDRVLILVIDS